MAKKAQKTPAAGRQWPADRVERRDIEALIPYARNARLHSEEQVAAIAASIREWGWTVPVLVDESGELIAGHGRVLAARSLGLTSIPVMVASDWSDEQKRAYRIADNRLAEGSTWDEDLLRIELGELAGETFDLGLLGFGKAELDRMLAPPANTEPKVPRASLADRFGLPPFSVLNAREGWWQDRKRAWLALGIKSELGRGENLASMGGAIERREAIKKGRGRRDVEAG